MKDTQSDNSHMQGIDSGDKFNFKCPYCSRNLSSRQNLKEHLHTHTGNKPYVCKQPGCGKEFRQGSLLSIHKRVHKEIKEGMANGRVAHRRIEYPKLTYLIEKIGSGIHVPLREDEREQWLGKIAENEFKFLMMFLEKLS